MNDLWAWVTVDRKGESNIVGVMLPGLGHSPMVFANARIAMSPDVRAIVANQVRANRTQAKLQHFRVIETLDTVRFEE